MKIAHLTSVHHRYDTRILLKECTSLSTFGYDVYLIVADGKEDELIQNINILDVGKPSGRLNRILTSTNKIYKKALEVDANIYHLHDPELIPIGLKLKKKGKIVIFDSHENVSQQILGKPYLQKSLKKIISRLYSYYEKYSLSKFDGIISATTSIKEKLIKINKNTIAVNNFPIINDITNTNIIWDKKENRICYVGAISNIRGIKEMVESVSDIKTNTKITIGGNFPNNKFENEVKNNKNSNEIEFLGFLNRKQINELFSISKAGLVVLHPTINYLDSLPVKMFEYMAAGIPIIASNFPLWKEIISSNNCGLLVNPLEPTEIANAIDFIINNSDISKEMGKNARVAIEKKYNWSIECEKLLDFYTKIDELSLSN
ncbi:putative Glycosyl transferases group 1 [Xenorhabdus bovienii str. Jollieti]|uniref:Putative Glycosyl transferases group 1 n=1 Tax=Xenorhabdus bovienii (strain SS-2004) TaxID=406818 RepID=D3V700_XENBS|nr:glycosyltransferase [Xenorhabdus bovienii]CBJ83429.1 putative Glycosyl transferases group 1 [Xenorhabdus bovienii SS-2004]CDH29310.1 putative Glycosyl transferases group 1 [Xenorhabdus bovienii str. Jollieti]